MGGRRVATRILLVLGIVAVFVAVGAYEHGRTEDAALERALQAQRAETLSAFLAEGPAVDEDLQERFWAWHRRAEPLPGGWSDEKEEAWYLRGDETPPERVAKRFAGMRPTMEAFAGFLDSDRLLLGTRGWLRRDLAGADRAPWDRPLRSAAWPFAYGALRWYGMEAMRAEDPAPALARLERLRRAVLPIGTDHDLIVQRLVLPVRDRCLLRLAARGALPDETFDAWVAEPAPPWALLAEGARATRILYVQPLARDVEADPFEAVASRRSHRGDLGRWVRGTAYAFLGARRDARLLLRLHALLERHGRSEVGDAALTPIGTWQAEGGWFFQLWVGDPILSLFCHAEWRAMHRMHRLAALALRCARETGTAPATDAALRAWLGPRASMLDGGARDLRLVYEAASPSHVRIAVSPTAPLPALFEDRFGAETRGASSVDEPLAKPLLLVRGCSAVEVAVRRP